ncbi:hypothetical protein LCL95_10485 [Bacillus timonensis]|nr:hypothetical protein [Bacillus timonensis]
MVKLNEAQYELINQYRDLLDTIDEGFTYLIDSFSNLELSHGDRILADIFSALVQIGTTSDQLLSIFPENHEVSIRIHLFSGVLTEIEKLEAVMQDELQKQLLIKLTIFPAYLAWKEQVQSALEKYVSH